METTVTQRDAFASTYCGGTWLTAPPFILDELNRFGFQYYSFANNHSMDYSYGGLRSTLQALRARKLAYSGAGEDLACATRHAAVSTSRGSVGLIAVTATCNDSARAGDPHGPILGRPGVSMLRHRETFAVRAAHMAALEEIALATNINGRINNSKRGGYTLSSPGVFNLGPLCFVQDECEGKRTTPHEGDCCRITAAIKAALTEVDYAVVCLHSHEIRGATDDEPDFFVEEFAHRCVDAGACAVICSGTHQIKAVEIYKNAPIFYSIANFIFQSDAVEELPADFCEKYGVDMACSAKEALAVRSANGTRGLQSDVSNYRGLVPMLELDGGRVRRVEIQPTELCFELGYPLKGLPRKADEKTIGIILSRLQTLSAPYGTIFEVWDGLISIDMGDADGADNV